MPAARFLADARHHVTGVDISDVQIERARRLVPTAGNSAWTGTEDNWLDGSATMWWSHADASNVPLMAATGGADPHRRELHPGRRRRAQYG